MIDLKKLKIKIFADGADLKSILELDKNPMIKGFTTNPTLMRKAGITSYVEFAKDILKKINKPISFEVFADDLQSMRIQAKEIASWSNNVNVKIPITNTKGESTIELIKELSKDGIICNVTAIFTLEQVAEVLDVINPKTSSILSIFAGRIADTGVDPVPIMKEALKMADNNSKASILWASPREILNIFQAEQIGCHIITVSHDILNKLSIINKDLKEFSLETVLMFFNDAKSAGYNIETEIKD